MPQEVYEVWKAKHPRDSRYSDVDFERRESTTTINEAIGYAKNRLDSEHDRYERRANDNQTVEHEQHRFDPPEPVETADLPFHKDDKIAFKGTIKTSGDGKVSVTKTNVTYYVVINEAT